MLPCRAAFRCLQALAVAPLVIPVAGIPSKVTVEGRRLLVNGVPVHLKGVNWNPVPRGSRHPDGLDYSGSAVLDGRLMREAGINAVRSYECICDPAVLDVLWNNSIYVLNTVFANAGEGLGNVSAKVNAVKDHPAVLMWVVGNEWNYNGCYDNLSHDECMVYIRQAANIVKHNDKNHPVATIYGRLPKPEVVGNLSVIDVWGSNYYHGLGFHDKDLGGTGSLFAEWAALSDLPLFIGEYGADAWDTLRGQEDLESQARAVTVLTEKIVHHSSVRKGVCLGGMLFEFADEWWKDYTGNETTHDTTGFDWGGGPYPDMRFNEEWWGLMDIDRNPRPVYYAYRDVPMPALPMPASTDATRAQAGAAGSAATVVPPVTRRLATLMVQV